MDEIVELGFLKNLMDKTNEWLLEHAAHGEIRMQIVDHRVVVRLCHHGKETSAGGVRLEIGLEEALSNELLGVVERC